MRKYFAGTQPPSRSHFGDTSGTPSPSATHRLTNRRPPALGQAEGRIDFRTIRQFHAQSSTYCRSFWSYERGTRTTRAANAPALSMDAPGKHQEHARTSESFEGPRAAGNSRGATRFQSETETGSGIPDFYGSSSSSRLFTASSSDSPVRFLNRTTPLRSMTNVEGHWVTFHRSAVRPRIVSSQQTGQCMPSASTIFFSSRRPAPLPTPSI